MYINFYPQQAGESREFWVDGFAGYAVENPLNFVLGALHHQPVSVDLGEMEKVLVSAQFLIDVADNWHSREEVLDLFDEIDASLDKQLIYNL